MITNNATQLEEPEKRPFGTPIYVGRAQSWRSRTHYVNCLSTSLDCM
jgi:hypothetical protein